MYGMNALQIKASLKRRIKENSDIYYYIDDVYIEKVVDLIIDGFAEVIEENNKKLVVDMMRDLERKIRF